MDVEAIAQEELEALEQRSEGKDPTEALIEYFNDPDVDMDRKACVATYLLTSLPVV